MTHGARARRAAARAVAVVAVLGAVVALAVYAAAEDDVAPPPPPEAAEPSPVGTCRPGPPPDAPARRRYAQPERMLEPGVDYRATIVTSCGDIALDLLEDAAPEAVNSFVFLARAGYYDGRRWARVERRFLIQTGDPNDRLLDPPEDAGYELPAELPDRPQDYVCGTVATTASGEPGVVRSGAFFVVVHSCDEIVEATPGATPPRPEPAGLQKLYSIFGTVDESSYETIVWISRQPVTGGDEPVTSVEPAVPVWIERVEIEERR
ncbi:MAG TPA: peptidylprolyl isomerase [Actinomycetota bacterium]|nr:peptidylprolyl isomerase [Actinomycetota bacterium]